MVNGEVEITALISKSGVRTYEVPISYYGRRYEEGKKIGLTAPRLASGRRYVDKVKSLLATRERRAPVTFASESVA